MMTPEQTKNVVFVYNHLIDKENRGWDALDDYIQTLEYLGDEELCIEVEIAYAYHDGFQVKCEQTHTKEQCFIPLLVEAVCSIVELYKKTGDMHQKNKYILHYYLAMDQAKMILVDT
jgi:hypothetical protein